jgi:hypothetical protein
MRFLCTNPAPCLSQCPECRALVQAQLRELACPHATGVKCDDCWAEDSVKECQT